MDKEIQFIPDIEMQPIHVMQTLSQTTDWGLMQSNIPGAWAYTEGEGITIAVLDTGVWDHSDLRDNLLPALNFSGESDNKDWNGHGCIAPFDKIFIQGFGITTIQDFYENSKPEYVYVDNKDGFTIKKIENQNLLVLSFNDNKFEMNKITAVHELNHIGEVYKVKTNSSEMTLTPWHPIYIQDGATYKKVRAEELKVGDNLYSVTPTEINFNNSKLFYSSKFECIYCGYISRGSKRNQCKKCNKCKWQKQVDTFIELDEDLAFLAGLIISDGHVMKLENSIEFCGNDINLVNICFDLFEKIFNVTPRRLNDKNRNSYRIRANCVELKEFFINQLGIPQGSKSLLISLPDIFKKCSDSIFSAFIAGVIEGDGHIDKSNWRIRICSGSKTFVDDLKLNLKFRGIKSSIHSFNQQWTENLGYHIKFNATPLIAKNLKIKTSDRFIPVARKYEKIQEIYVDFYQGKLYDLTVENTSNYIANGFVVSNTHCAGIIAAANNDFGVVGIAPKAKILPVKVLGNGGNGSYDNIIAGINAAVDCNVDIISMSLGASSAPPELYTAIKRAADAGVILIAAAGNDAGAVNYPARFEEVIAVAALDARGNMAHFSSHGPEVDAIAPGVDIYSTYKDNGYAKLNGTSQACPFIAGVCALMLAWTRKNPSLKPICDYKDMLQRLDDVSSLESQNITIGRTGDWGFGVPKYANMKFN
jgi:subtilisin family serine protease